MSFHGSATVSAAGTSVPLVASTVLTPTGRFCAAVVIQYDGGANVYGGFGTVAADVSATSFGWHLSSAIPAVTIGDVGDRSNPIDLTQIRIDSDTSSEKVRFTAIQY